MSSDKKPPPLSSKVTLIITVDEYIEFKDSEYVGYDVQMTRNNIREDGTKEKMVVGGIEEALGILSGAIISLLSDHVDHPVVRVQAAINCGRNIVGCVVNESGLQPFNGDEDIPPVQEEKEEKKLSAEQQKALNLTMYWSGFKTPIEG